MLKDFKTFIMRGNVVDLAVGIIIGAAFGAIVSSLVKDIIMPPIGMALSGVDFSALMVILKEGATPGPYVDPGAAAAAGAVTMNYGVFLLSIISFIIVAAVVFFFVVRPVARMRAPKEAAAPAPAAPTTRDCPYCVTAIPIKASRCPHCTSELAK